eukprot:jgi/Chlat1/3021/Chrsp201S03271
MSKYITWESVVYPDGAMYEGLMKEGGVCQYRGVFMYKDGDRYEGEYRDNQMTGYGVYYWKDTDSTFYGQWKNNNMHGCGVKVYPDDVLEEGEWLEDAFVGDDMACPAQEAHKAADAAKKMAARARLYLHKPDGGKHSTGLHYTTIAAMDAKMECNLLAEVPVPPEEQHDTNPLIYAPGAEFLAPGPLGDEFEVPPAAAKEVVEGQKALWAIADAYKEVQKANNTQAATDKTKSISTQRGAPQMQMASVPQSPLRPVSTALASISMSAQRLFSQFGQFGKPRTQQQSDATTARAAKSEAGPKMVLDAEQPSRKSAVEPTRLSKRRPGVFASLSLSRRR